ncbi:MAG: hypothetical protein WBL79_00975 [Bacillota bacterium]|jgi:hypothetical protein|nr:hypothetical protein [Bacillota bacterium]HOB41693.1 hypothetical protein [Bacillota bacterium]HOK70578.1 hypothetical protein [Bacillota bacterium]HOL52513.1 hypothetical protein [Bacillota bacterium]HOO30687.1 hypothetical protein [Bacillota bacterium]
MTRETVIASFVIRFVKPAVSMGPLERADMDLDDGAPNLRIAVRHIQGGYERRFADLDDAIGFIRDEIQLLELE